MADPTVRAESIPNGSGPQVASAPPHPYVFDPPYVFEFGPLERTAYAIQHGEPSHRARLLRVIDYRETAEKARIEHEPLWRQRSWSDMASLFFNLQMARSWAMSYPEDEPAWTTEQLMDYQVLTCASCGTKRAIGDLAWIEVFKSTDDLETSIRLPYCHSAFSSGPSCYMEAQGQAQSARLPDRRE